MGIKKVKLISLLIVFFVMSGIFLTSRSMGAETNINKNVIFRVEKGESAQDITTRLERDGFISSTFIFNLYLRLLGADKNIQSGDYLFEGGISSWTIAHRFAKGDYNLSLIKITIPEGSTVEDIAGIISKNIEAVDRESFIAEAQSYEGYLFPDTYFFSPVERTTDIIQKMRSNFDARTETMKPAFASSKKKIDDIITMASIIEKETDNETDRRIVSGILWKRIYIDMPLQVDASFAYYLHKTSRELTQNDLKTDSPYNTYIHRGLPKGPISNPGLASIKATLFPTKSNYLYYLNGRDGKTRYAETLEEHKKNRAKYLD
ncbi:MAG: endolytic transglycosylase MltG [Candidatus Vogelbacteria bacterium]|nr:endolytic transglycosylase MltG [Candidatus Vogelbacteria bacterium]